MKLREEIETVIGDGETMLRCFEQLGYGVWFRYQKYREEYALSDVIVAIDETPVGVFVEVEGDEHGIVEQRVFLQAAAPERRGAERRHRGARLFNRPEPELHLALERRGHGHRRLYVLQPGRL